MARILYTDGTSKEITPSNGKYFTLEEKQQIVGGYIEICETTDPDGEHCLIINEEGKLEGLEYNPEATDRYKYHIWNGRLNDFIVGTAIYGKYSEFFDEDYKAARRAERKRNKK